MMTTDAGEESEQMFFFFFLIFCFTAQNEAEYARFRERVLVAEGLLEEGKYGQCIGEYEEIAREFKPNYYFGELYLGLGCAFVGLNQPQHAVGVFEQALEYDPHNTNIYLNTGLAYSALGGEKTKEALDVFKRGIEVAKRQNETELLLQFMIYCGQLYEELEDEGSALKMYHDALIEGPDYSQVWYLAGCIYANQENKEQAIKYFSEAIQCTMPWPSAYYKLSRMVDDPEEKKKLYSMFVEAQKELAYLEGKQGKTTNV